MPPPPTIHSLKDVTRVLAEIPDGDAGAAKTAEEREPLLTKPPGSLGRLEELTAWLCRWQGRHPPSMGNIQAQVFAGNHGVTQQGVSAYPADVTAQMVANFEAGGAAINQLCKTFGIGFAVHPLALDRPTQDFTEDPAMSEDECLDAIVFGMGTISDGIDVLCLGEMGIGNTTAAAALCLGLFGGDAVDWTGQGTGVSGKALSVKTKIVTVAAKRHGEESTGPIDLLRRLGGRELAAIAGAVLAARFRRVPVLLDGYVATAAAAVLEAARPGTLDHTRIGHVSTEPGHRLLLDKLAKTPVLDLNMRLGEATGAVLAVQVLKAAVACHTGMATFEEAAITGKSG